MTAPGAEGADTASAGEAPEDVVAPLDLMLSDAALGVLRRFRPNLSLTRFGLRLARQPGTVSRRAARQPRPNGVSP